MKLKKGVSLLGVKPEIIIALLIADGIYSEEGQELVVTSLVDGKHSKSSKHYLGLASDLRTNYFTPPEIDYVVSRLKAALGAEFYVAFETNHIHIQFNGSVRGEA